MWIEWIPNISTVDEEILQEIVYLFSEIPDLFVLHIDRGWEVNRTVLTVAGTVISLRKALYALLSLLNQKIDMSTHIGSHPRIGALDVSPYVILKNGSTSELLIWVSKMARDISEKYNFPVYLYEQSAIHPQRINLADIRRGEYEGLRIKLIDPAWKPDYGKAFHPRLGATVMGVRDFLIAYNVNIDTTDVKVAKAIARQIRSKGELNRPHKLPGVKAIGWYLQDSGFCQVSTNITKTWETTPLDVFTRCQWLAEEYGCQVTGSELIGLIPYHSVAKMLSHGPESRILLTSHLGLGYSNIQDLQERIIEHKLYIASGKSLFNEIFDIE